MWNAQLSKKYQRPKGCAFVVKMHNTSNNNVANKMGLLLSLSVYYLSHTVRASCILIPTFKHGSYLKPQMFICTRSPTEGENGPQPHKKPTITFAHVAKVSCRLQLQRLLHIESKANSVLLWSLQTAKPFCVLLDYSASRQPLYLI